jgi:hypothetical protein
MVALFSGEKGADAIVAALDLLEHMRLERSWILAQAKVRRAR